MKIAILDDEIYYCNKIHELILERNYLEKCKIDKYTKAKDFINSSKDYDIILLDIDMPEIDGIALAKQLRYENIIIIFITGIPDRMAEAFGINVAGYIFKNQLETQIGCVLNETFKLVNQNRKITISNKKEIYRFNPMNILYIEYVQKHVFVHLTHEYEDIGYIPFKEILPLLPSQFIQVNKNQIINIDNVKKMKGNIITLNHTNVEIEVSRRKKESIFELIMKVMERI